jgi:hypothetical protein
MKKKIDEFLKNWAKASDSYYEANSKNTTKP